MDDFMKHMKPINDALSRHQDLLVWLVPIVIAVLWWDKLRNRKKVAGQSVASSMPVRGGFLSQGLFAWGPHDFFRLVDLVRSILVIGATGSGKTSGSLFYIGKALARCKKGVSLLIFSSKPEEGSWWHGIYAKAGRIKDLLIFSPDSGLRCNGLDFIQRMGGSPQDVTNGLMAIKETLQNNEKAGGDHASFWKPQERQMIEHMVTITQLATGRIDPGLMQEFLNGAARTPDELKKDEWKQGIHYRCLKEAGNRARNSIEQHDCRQARSYFIERYPAMADKMRSGIETGVFQTLHFFNYGIVNALICKDTNVSPLDLEHGKSILIDMPISSYGMGGALVNALWKYITQLYVLKRKVTENGSVIVLWSDEHQKTVNSYDASFLAECRSHRGCMVCATQSIHSFYTKMREGNDHEADSYLTNFHTQIAHALGDVKSAEYFSGLIGKRPKKRRGGSMAPGENVSDALFGRSRFTSSYNEQMENIVEPNVFMQNLRTGGAENGFIVDGIVVRSAEPFSNNEAYLPVSFSQK